MRTIGPSDSTELRRARQDRERTQGSLPKRWLVYLAATNVSLNVQRRSASSGSGAQGLALANGAPVADNLNILTAGPRGPALLEGIWLIEKLAHFDREVIP